MNSHQPHLSIKVLYVFCIFTLLTLYSPSQFASGAGDNPNPPQEIVKLVFIHHSTGENWLTDSYGNLGMTLATNNYFVSDTNYGWGPDAIGDRTDIPNWLEWFRSPSTPQYVGALLAENNQNSAYTRSLSDPGGENQIVMFKSCFPNSALEGDPNDPPAPGDGLSVSNAKYIYNELLKSFRTRPDKLFIVITAPPLSDPTYAQNARAFNTWLVQDWLEENDYPYANVAVFDFFNVLTHPENHHLFRDGKIEYINNNGNSTLAYPSGDDHPNEQGSQKATAEFIPLLNVYYHRWKASNPPTSSSQPVEFGQPAQSGSEIQVPLIMNPTGSGWIDDFENPSGLNTEGWQTFFDEATPTTISCEIQGENVHGGAKAMHITFNVAANSWATCALIFNTVQDWQPYQGISYFVRATQPAILFDLDVYGGSREQMTTHLYTVETNPDMTSGWVEMNHTWDQILRASWEANAGTAIDPKQVVGLAIGFSTLPDTPNTGEIWIDDLSFLGATPAQPQVVQPTQEIVLNATPTMGVLPAEETPQKRTCGICASPIFMGLLLSSLGIVRWRDRKLR